MTNTFALLEEIDRLNAELATLRAEAATCERIIQRLLKRIAILESPERYALQMLADSHANMDSKANVSH